MCTATQTRRRLLPAEVPVSPSETFPPLAAQGAGKATWTWFCWLTAPRACAPQNFELVKRFVNQIVDFLDVSPEGTRVGLVQFSSRVRTEFPLGRYGTAAEVKQAVLAVEYMERGTMTGLALRHMVEHSFSEAQGARPRVLNVPRVGLVFTDGRSQDDISVWAARAKEEGELGAGCTGLGSGWMRGGGFSEV